VILLLVSSSCLSQESQNNNRVYIQIEDAYFILKESHRNDVERFLGMPSNITFFEHGIEDFFWTNFTVCTYEDGMLSFHYNEEGNIIRYLLILNIVEKSNYLMDYLTT